MAGPMRIQAAPPPFPVVEAEYRVYEIGNPANGAGPLWCYGSTCLVRAGREVFASGLEIRPEQKPLNNVRWTLFRLDEKEAQRLQADSEGRQREPCPIGLFKDGRLLLTSNPTLTPPGAYSGPAQPQLLIFDTKRPEAPPLLSHPQWKDNPRFTEHSYRAFAADSPNREALYLQNVGYDTAHWSFLDRDGQWSKSGSIRMPWGAEFEKPQPIRICYQNLALRNRTACLLGVSDIIEWVREWREYKLILHEGNQWDYDFRRLYFCRTPDITKEPFGEWIKVAECEKCGHITNLDLWLDGEGRAHILWIEQNIWDARVRNKFFPGEPITHALMYGVIEGNRLVRKTCLALGGEQQASREIPGWGRFQATPDGRLFVFYYAGGSDNSGKAVSENRLVEINPDGTAGQPARVNLRRPMKTFFTASERGGSAPSATLDLLGEAEGISGISYARINLLGKIRVEFDWVLTPAPDGWEISLDAGSSGSTGGRIVSCSWRIGEQTAAGSKVRQKIARGGPLEIELTVRDAKGNRGRFTRTFWLPPTPADLGLRQWGLLLRVEAEHFAAGKGGNTQTGTGTDVSGLVLSHRGTAGDWLEWEVEVPAEDRYYLLARYLAPAGALFKLAVDGQPPVEVALPAGNGERGKWDLAALTERGQPASIRLTAGRHRLRLENRTDQRLDLDYLELAAAGTPFPDRKLNGWRPGEENGRRYLAALAGIIPPDRITTENGLCYNYHLGPAYPGDGLESEGVAASTLRLFEDGRELGPAHAPHAEIRRQGKGRFSHWKGLLYFSSSDGNDPRTNGRRYTWRLED